ncbi:unnamed protein product [Mytilus coruscus]|uniref:Novel STAND NTPase 3 domain-containing protein n=1 Tax=Mytilus coruscus TaxID=42192 RepID=A0A6J8EWP8_MYTCO|nr:unnamed protein product [Mytilus coruscus]
MRTNRKLGMLQSFIHQYTIIMFTVTMVVAVNKPTFKCPDPSQWKFRAKSICNDTEKYICLFDENGQRDEEFCGSWPDFENPGYKQILLGGTTRKPCSEYRFQPFTFWTNGSSKCVYKKTFCNQEGQVIYNNGTAQSDRTCRCDYTKNYDFQVKPENNCFCVPSREDCSCYVKPCPAGSRLTPDYECLEESRWKLSFFSCLEIKEDSIDDPVVMSTIISTYGYEMPSDSVAWPSVSVTVLCIAAACIVVLSKRIFNVNVHVKCIKGKTQTMSHDKISSIIVFPEIKQTQKGKNDFNRNETTNIPIDVLDLQEKEIVKWRKRQQNFEETHASTTVLETVKTNGFVILSGPPGSGKSVIAYNTAFILEKKENFKIMPVSSPEEIRKYLLSKTKQVFVIDDPVGKYTVDDICIQRWKNEEIFIKQTFTDFSNTKLILTCRTYIYKSGFCRQLHVPPIHCDLLSHNFKLSLFERRKICRRYKIPELNEDTIMMYNCLPLLCVSYSNKEDTIDYFSNPYKVLTDEMINTKENSDIAFLAIAFLVVRDGTIEKQILTFANTETKDLLNDLCDECGFKYFPSTKVILTALCNLIGTYVTEKDDIFSFIHDNLFRNLSFIVGGYFIDCLLKYGSTDFWTKRLQFASLNKNHDELVIIVSPEHEKSYFERLILDIKKGHHRKVFTGIQMQFSEFRTNLVKELRHLHSEDFKSDDKKTTFLHVVAEQGYEDLVFEIVNLKEIK